MPDEQLPAIGLLSEAVGRVEAADPADTITVLGAAWHGFCAAGAAGKLLAMRADPDEYPALWDNARPVFDAAIGALRAAPSLPSGLPAEFLRAATSAGRLDDSAAAQVRGLILDLALALNSTLHAAEQHATGNADREACQNGITLSSKLSDCYEGRLSTFLKAPPLRGKRHRPDG